LSDEPTVGPGCYVCGEDNEHGLGLQWAFRPGDPMVLATFTPRPGHCGARGFVHGGVLAACIDEAMAAVGYGDEEARFVTAKLEVKYVRPVALDDAPVQFEAWLDRPTPFGYQARGRARVRGGAVAVSAKGLFTRAPAAMTD
jgi:acyl-coenzyme A thioesterase PaaI-like protein